MDEHEAAEEQTIRRYYTPAMLADLVKIPVATIRRWHRRGLITASHEVGRLAYFDFEAVATARHLGQLIASGSRPAVIEGKLVDLAKVAPLAQRSLAELPIVVEGKHVLLRRDEGLVDVGGQLWLDFDTARESSAASHGERSEILAFRVSEENAPVVSAEELVERAFAFEDEGQLEAAAEAYRGALAATGPTPDLCFQLAEVLYRLGDITAARERYFMAIELDENYVEARANLGCVLAELGQTDLARAAFEGALAFHENYPDAHYHLARLLDEGGDLEAARHHWARFLEYSPDSPWAHEARSHLGP